MIKTFTISIYISNYIYKTQNYTNTSNSIHLIFSQDKDSRLTQRTITYIVCQMFVFHKCDCYLMVTSDCCTFLSLNVYFKHTNSVCHLLCTLYACIVGVCWLTFTLNTYTNTYSQNSYINYTYKHACILINVFINSSSYKTINSYQLQSVIAR